MPTMGERQRVHDHLLVMARKDSRVTSAAAVGSLAHGQGDQWSDVDLTFGVADEIAVEDVLDDWAAEVIRAFEAVHLLDLHAGAAIYLVFLLPTGLQVDMSFAPQADFAATSTDFRLLFGSAKESLMFRLG
jgi:predicted nucleotidyltransferase